MVIEIKQLTVSNAGDVKKTFQNEQVEATLSFMRLPVRADWLPLVTALHVPLSQ